MGPTDLDNASDLEKAFKKFNKMLYNYAFLRLRSRELAEDVVQEVFMKAWRSKDTFDKNKASLKNWFFAITTNTIFTYLNQYKRHPIETLDEETSKKTKDEIEEDISKKNLIGFAFEKMKMLTDREQELLILRYKQDLPIKDIAKILNMKPSATTVAIHRAIRKLSSLCQEGEK